MKPIDPNCPKMPCGPRPGYPVAVLPPSNHYNLSASFATKKELAAVEGLIGGLPDLVADASTKADAAEQAAAAASAKADAKQDKLPFTSTPNDKDNKVVTQGYVDGVKTDAAAARKAADAAAADAKASATSAGTASADAAAAKASATSAETAAGQAQAAAATAADDVGTARTAASSAQSDAALAGDAAYRAEGAATAAKNAASDAQNAVSQHSSNTNNPHSVTASQIGAYTKTEVDDELDAKQDKLSFTSSDGCSAANPVALKDYVDAAVEGSVSEESDPVFTAWRRSSLIRMGGSSGYFIGVSSGVFTDFGNYAVVGCDGLVALGQSLKLAKSPAVVSIGNGHFAQEAEGSVLLGVEPSTYSKYTVAIGRLAGSRPDDPATQSGNESAVAIGNEVLFHGPSTFSVVADGLAKIYLGAGADAETLEKKLGDWFADTLKFAEDSDYAYDKSSNPAVTKNLLDAELKERDDLITGKQEKLYFTNTEATDDVYAPDRDNYVITRKMLNVDVGGLADDIQSLEDLHYQDWCHRPLYYFDPPSVDLSVNEYAKTNADGIKLNEYPLEYNHAVVVVNDEGNSMDVLTVTLPYTFGHPVKSSDNEHINNTFDCILYVTVAEYEIVTHVFKLTDYFAGKALSDSYKRGFSVSYSEGSPAVLDGGEDGTTYVIRILGRNGDPGKKAPQFYIDIRRYAAEASAGEPEDSGGSYRTMLALGNDLDLSAGCDRKVVRMELEGASASLRLPDLSDSPEKAFDCVVWLVPNGASEDGPLELICADGDVHLADGSEAKVWKDGMTVVTVTGTAQLSANSTPVYLVSVKHFSKLAGDA